MPVAGEGQASRVYQHRPAWVGSGGAISERRSRATDRPSAGSDAADAAWHDVTDISAVSLAFDHDVILGDGVERARAKLEYSPLATAFCPPEFTIAELRVVYEAVWGVSLDPRNFHRKITGTPGFVRPTDGRTVRNGGRPAQLFTRGHAQLLHPPMLRPT